jgi:hypothetical protein
MMIFKKAIPRRTVLRGMGATLALPFLDGMVPAFAADDAARSALRFSVVYVPNGMIMEKWIPPTEGTGFALSPILEPLAPFKERLLVLSGLSHMIAERRAGEGSAPHSRASGGYLTGIHADKEPTAGISVDQIVAREFGKRTQLQSLELSLEPGLTAGSCDGNLSCSYTNTISWRSETTPMPTENNPRAVFERLFGDNNSTDPAERRIQIQEDRSVLDTAIEGVARLSASLSLGDRGKLAEYLDAIRDVERRIQLADKASGELPTLERPAGIPSTFEEYAKLMFDLQILAYQTDMTRVITCMMGHELSGRTYREIGISEPHHPLSHHAGDEEKIAKVLRINIFHAKTFGYFLEKLRSTPDGDGSLLDHMVVLYGAGLGDGNFHGNNNLPALLAGGAGGKLNRGGRHIRYSSEPPIANLWVTLLDLLGTPVERFGDSTGKLDI